jgi:hypothetical protein
MSGGGVKGGGAASGIGGEIADGVVSGGGVPVPVPWFHIGDSSD